MTNLLALLLPVGMMAVSPATEAGDDGIVEFLPDSVSEAVEQQPSDVEVWSELIEAYRPENGEQVRIERRVIMRISPRASVMPDMAMPPMPSRRSEPAEFEEQNMGKCVPIKKISNVRVANNNRLVLFMRDNRMVSAKLEKSCSARDFYSGFYVEQPEDGKICAGRDTIHSRAGVNCELSRFYRLVPAGE